jgi:hypothetical protein
MKKRTILAAGILMIMAVWAGLAVASSDTTTNTFYGWHAGENDHSNGAHNNTFIGAYSGYLNPTTGGQRNNFLGFQAGYNNIGNSGDSDAGSYNSFIGAEAGYHNTTGQSNIFIGDQAGYTNTTGFYNTYIGDNAGKDGTGNFNTILGGGAGQNNASGYLNTYAGVATGVTATTGHNNVFIGAGAGFSETGNNKLYIDNCSNGTNSTDFSVTPCTSNPLIYGEFDNRIVKINGTVIMTGTFAQASDIRYKKNIVPLKSSLDKVMHLKGVSYEWKAEENPGSGFKKGRDIGLIAQEVEAVIPELIVTDSKGYKALSYDKMVPVLVEAIKEQQNVIKELKGEMTKLIAEVNKLKSKDMTAQK